jgi:hypothetical protein
MTKNKGIIIESGEIVEVEEKPIVSSTNSHVKPNIITTFIKSLSGYLLVNGVAQSASFAYRIAGIVYQYASKNNVSLVFDDLDNLKTLRTDLMNDKSFTLDKTDLDIISEFFSEVWFSKDCDNQTKFYAEYLTNYM